MPVHASALFKMLNSPETKPRRLNVGCGRNVIPGWVNLDSQRLPGVDVVADLELCDLAPLPLDDDSFDEFLLSHLIEHIRAPLPMMQELHRIARPGAKAIVRVPYGSSDDAWEDQTHIRAYFLQSFGYFSQPYYWRADYGYRGDWQPVEITLLMSKQKYGSMSQAALLATISRERNVVQEMVCVLQAIKPAREPRRDLQKLPELKFAFA